MIPRRSRFNFISHPWLRRWEQGLSENSLISVVASKNSARKTADISTVAQKEFAAPWKIFYVCVSECRLLLNLVTTMIYGAHHETPLQVERQGGTQRCTRCVCCF